MKQSYLNARQRTETTIMYKVLGHLGTIFGAWEKYNKLDEKESQMLTDSLKSFHDLLVSILDSIDKKQATQIINDALNLELFCLPVREATKKKEDFLNNPDSEFMEVDSTAFYELAGYATTACKKCEELESDACHLKIILTKLNVPVFNIDNSFCPYSYSRSTKRVDLNTFIEMYRDIHSKDPSQLEIIHFEYFRMLHRLYYEKNLTKALLKRFILTGVGSKIELLRDGVEKNAEKIKNPE